MQIRALSILVALAAFAATAADSIEVYFSPKGGATDAILDLPAQRVRTHCQSEGGQISRTCPHIFLNNSQHLCKNS